MWNQSGVKTAIGVGANELWFQNSGNSLNHISFFTGATAGTAPSEALRITSSGNVGIGTVAPANELDVAGAVAIGSYAGITGPTSGLIVSGDVGIGTSAPTAPLNMSVGSTTGPHMLLNSSGTDAIISLKNTGTSGREYWIDSGSSGAGIGAGNFAIYDRTAGGGSGPTRLVISPSGYVGIAMTSPAATFDVNGTVKFRAGINAEVRVVTAAGAVTVTTADYIVCINKTTGAATTVNLPSSPSTGDQYVIKDCKGDAATNNITVTPAAGNIDGSSTYILSTARQSIGIFYDGTQWEVF